MVLVLLLGLLYLGHKLEFDRIVGSDELLVSYRQAMDADVKMSTN